MKAFRFVASLLCAILMAIVLMLLGIAISISHTALDADFVINRLRDVPVEDFFAAEARKQVPAGGEFLFALIDQAAGDLAPWARDQAAEIVRAAEIYLHGDNPFSATIYFAEAKRYLQTHMSDAMAEAGLPINRLSKAQLSMLVGQIMQQVDAIVPDKFEITEAFLDADTLLSLQMARSYTAVVRTGLWLMPLLAFALLLVIGWAQSWRAHGVARFAGIAMMLAAIGTVIARLVVLSWLSAMVPSAVPSQLNAVLPGVIESCVGPMLPYALMTSLVGVGLLLISTLLQRVSSSAISDPGAQGSVSLSD